MDDEPKDGALLDLRPTEERAGDILFEEVVASAAPVVWTEKSPDKWRSFPIFNQGTSGSCVAQTLKKMLGVHVWLSTNVFVKLSASHIYQRRKNRPNDGMGGADAFEIVAKGTTLEDFAPSEMMSDMQMDSVVVKPFMEKIGEVFKTGRPIVGPTKDIETVASIIQKTGKAVMVWFYFSSGKTPREWTAIPKIQYPNLDLNASTGVARHSVAAIDWTLLGRSNVPSYPEYWGKKALIIDDSSFSDNAIKGRRIITEDFFKKRNWYTAHFMNFAFEQSTDPKPSYDGSVVSLQDCLKHYGTFPTNIESTGFMGAVTKDAINQFQVREGLHPTGTGTVGPQTKARLQALYP